jgi:DNA (cytosine-5)-methyltransferase 1
VLTHFSLFTGIGGIDLASEWAGFTTVGQVEIDDYCRKVLDKHWPDVPKWGDIRDVTRESVSARGIGRIDLLSGGFPCQPHSCAGKRKASADERDLWGEFARVIREIEPVWVLAENVRGLLSSESNRFFGRVLRDLADMGYSVGWCCYGANAVGAPHQRERVFIVAHASIEGSGGLSVFAGRSRQTDSDIEWRGQNLADTQTVHVQRFGNRQRQGQSWGGSRWPTQSRLGGDFARLSAGMDFPRWPSGPGAQQHEWEPPRIAKGVPHRTQRLKALGNAVVPAQVYPILQAIVDIETEAHEMITDKDGYHIEVRRQGREARLLGRPLSINWHPPGWLHDSFEAGWREIDEDPDAPKADIEQGVS